jgi:hypothetical protein
MTLIGANTPAMIKTITTDVESKNLIVTSVRGSPRAGMSPRQQVLEFVPS